ncbi:MAG TPA: sigma 54-interacting transcriptional regulator [Myxococcaceae bacterium]|nr:sigma 54-interacting transcriptional regulator [Myxococcaceae bacterium]
MPTPAPKPKEPLAVHWMGRAPDARLAAELKSVQLRPGRAPAGSALPYVVRSESPPARPPSARWIWVTDGAPSAEATRVAVLAGAYDAVPLSAPDGPARLLRRLAELGAEDAEPAAPPSFVGRSDASRAVLKQLALAARTSMPVLLTGETGTGKEVAARLIHEWSARRSGRFVPVNCAAIPNDLMEGELFGYERGAFSGAVRRYDGQLVAAEGGTVFLDEIDDTPMPLQVKLLRVLEDRVVSRLGESVWRQVDFRILAATNRDLRPLIATGAFGADLYERLAIVSVELPPLRQRIEDLPVLVEHLIARFYKEEPGASARGPVRAVHPDALAALAAYPWPGNIRELRNVVFGALVYKRGGDELLLSDLPRRILSREEPAPRTGGAEVVSAEEIGRRVSAGTFNLKDEVARLETLALEAALRRSGGSPTRAARYLGSVGRGRSSDPGGTVRAMMRRLGVREIA